MKSNPNGFGLYSKSGASYSVYTSSSHGATMKKLYMTPSSTETIITCSDKIKYNSRSGTSYTLETTINAAPST